MVSMQARRHALQEADALLRELDIAQDAQVDVFALIEQLELELVFNNLKTILGALVPQGNGGVMISTQRGPAVQRYTAAHEIGHWILDHESAFDTEADLYTPTQDREQLAQIFASQLLMPPPLVYAAAARYDLTSSATANGRLAYLMARDMGTSYEAVVRQLNNLDIINRSKRDELLSIQPATIKAELALGHRPDGNVDVWPVDMRASGGAITVTEGDEVVVMLPENRTTGYRWLNEDELRARAGRRIQPAPPIDPDTQICNSEPGWAPCRSVPVYGKTSPRRCATSPAIPMPLESCETRRRRTTRPPRSVATDRQGTRGHRLPWSFAPWTTPIILRGLPLAHPSDAPSGGPSLMALFSPRRSTPRPRATPPWSQRRYQRWTCQLVEPAPESLPCARLAKGTAPIASCTAPRTTRQQRQPRPIKSTSSPRQPLPPRNESATYAPPTTEARTPTMTTTSEWDRGGPHTVDGE